MEPILLQTSEEDRGTRLDAFLARSLEERGLNRDAKSAYELIVKYGLPTEAAAKQKIKNSEK